MENFTLFRVVKVVNPATGEESTKLRVVSSVGKEYNVLTDMPLETIKANKADLLTKIVIKDGQYGAYALFRKSEVLEEF